MERILRYPVILVLLFIAVASSAKTKEPGPKAEIVGDNYLGQVGKKAEISLKSERCILKSLGREGAEGEVPKAFKIELTCGDRTQVLWDINNPVPDDFAFDDPSFSLLWAGDSDGDGKIDLKMDLSPKYSCSKKVIFLSSKAKNAELVGISGKPKTTCGE